MRSSLLVSITGSDVDEAVAAKDEETVRELASLIWTELLPTLTLEVRPLARPLTHPPTRSPLRLLRLLHCKALHFDSYDLHLLSDEPHSCNLAPALLCFGCYSLSLIPLYPRFVSLF